MDHHSSKSNKTFPEDAFFNKCNRLRSQTLKTQSTLYKQNRTFFSHWFNDYVSFCIVYSFFLQFSLLSRLFFFFFCIKFGFIWMSAAWLVRRIVARKGGWRADKKHRSSALVAISQQLNTGQSDRLCLPSYYVSRRKASQHYLKIRPLTTAHGKREGKWKTDKASTNKQEQLLWRICFFFFGFAL